MRGATTMLAALALVTLGIAAIIYAVQGSAIFGDALLQAVAGIAALGSGSFLYAAAVRR